MKKISASSVLFVLLLLSPQIFAQDVASLVSQPSESEGASSIEGLVWNKWDTKNFIVLSLDKGQGLFVKNSIERVRLDFLDAWGLPSSDLPFQCKLICVPDKAMLRKLFSIDSPRFEAGRESEKNCAIWIDYDELDALPSLIAAMSASDRALDASPLLGRGLTVLSESVDKTRSLVVDVGEVDSKSVFNMTKEKFASLPKKDQDLFDRQSALICLLLRKEFGRKKFSKFVANSHGDSSIVSVFGFDGVEDFGRTLSRYSDNLSKDIKGGSAPDHYLTVSELIDP